METVREIAHSPRLLYWNDAFSPVRRRRQNGVFCRVGDLLGQCAAKFTSLGEERLAAAGMVAVCGIASVTTSGAAFWPAFPHGTP